jgi:hypothetical protein
LVGPNWPRFQDCKYNVFDQNNDQKRKFRFAERFCNGFGGNLASVHSQEEDDFIRSLHPNDVPMWLGGKFVDGELQWTDGSDNDYDGFKSGPSGDGDCVATGVSGGIAGYGWNDAPCSNVFRFVCKWCPLEETTVAPTTTEEAEAPAGWPQQTGEDWKKKLRKFNHKLRKQRLADQE